MGKVFIEESTLTAIGNAIRGKNGTTNMIAPLDMATIITNLPSGEKNYTVGLALYKASSAYSSTLSLNNYGSSWDDIIAVIWKGGGSSSSIMTNIFCPAYSKEEVLHFKNTSFAKIEASSLSFKYTLNEEKMSIDNSLTYAWNQWQSSAIILYKIKN